MIISRSFPILVVATLLLTGAGCAKGPASTGDSNKDTAKSGKVSGIADVCNYFPKELIEEAIGKPVLKVDGPTLTGYTNCAYYTIWAEDYDYSPYTGKQPGGAPVMVTYDTGENINKDRASNEKTGSTYVKDDSIPMDNFVVRDHGGTIWSVILVLGNDKYVRMHFVHSAVTGPELLKIAIKFAEKIQGK